MGHSPLSCECLLQFDSWKPLSETLGACCNVDSEVLLGSYWIRISQLSQGNLNFKWASHVHWHLRSSLIDNHIITELDKTYLYSTAAHLHFWVTDTVQRWWVHSNRKVTQSLCASDTRSPLPTMPWRADGLNWTDSSGFNFRILLFLD